MSLSAAPAARRTSPSSQRIRDLFAGTPGTMRLLQVTTAAVLTLFAILGVVAVSNRTSALASAKANADQLVRIQTLRTSLVQADASATNSFLVGGLEPVDQRAAYGDEVAAASQVIAAASAQNASDAVVLSQVNTQLVRYAGQIEAARANNRQGFAVGAAYIKGASGQLRSQVLPALSQLVTANENRVQDAYHRSALAATTLWVLAAVAAVLLIGGLAWFAARTRRWVNVGLASAGAVVTIGAILGGAAMVLAQHRADQVRAGAYRATAALAQARIDAFDAKSDESLTLIFRGSGQSFETEFARLATDGTAQLTTAGSITVVAGPPSADFASYLAVHHQIRTLDDSGAWDKAVVAATGSDAQGSNQTFATFDGSSGAALTAQVHHLDRDLASVRGLLVVGMWVVILTGLAAAVLSWRGIAVRLREYR